MQTADRMFFGKLMLFGEHTVHIGSPVLIMPFRKFSGKWEKNPLSFPQENNAFQEFIEYLDSTKDDFPWLKIHALKEAVREGWFFSSAIPFGYGVGSSGALVAAVYEKFALKQKEENLDELRDRLAAMESFFHGKSSGLDPLVCYLDKILVANDQSIRFVERNEKTLTKNLVLVDSGQTAVTAYLVEYFRQQLKSYRFFKKLRSDYLPAVDEAVKSRLLGDDERFFVALKTISTFQFENLPLMIPNHLRSFWIEGLEKDKFYLKLCGSGGGGYFLLFKTENQPLPKAPQGLSFVFTD